MFALSLSAGSPKKKPPDGGISFNADLTGAAAAATTPVRTVDTAFP